MVRRVVLLAPWFLLLAAVLASPPDKISPAERQQNLAQIKTGMSPDGVQQLLGPPDHRPRQILYRRFRELWLYDEPAGLRVEFDCQKGQEPRLVHFERPGSR